ncbi:MAG: class I SAM-dependent methyltransferase [Symploca sp. SIO3C6]|uniref:Class I SAM-dependent methyltransferase n=1 Tax=Symploca sp. SIO1C4 TaxID=2607765 RepID=A0A6B3MZ37_9CYAN|nr:class I SAM-dependent methyltransferase [Symploca sp. SIO3C6]NER26706.1 class I SAM-dependent methyltransferase [Symploca sp. SIO1C4]
MDKNEFLSKFDSLILNPVTRNIYGEDDFFNVGYWFSDTHNQQEACFNLMEKLLEFIPEKTGTILDVGCGLGATTSYLLKYYSPAEVLGINISSKQLERCRVNAPNCNFMEMDAVEMKFEDNKFDNIICVEAALYFDTREKFIKEAWRVLKPGGNLILADIISETTEDLGGLVVTQNIVKDFEAYKNLYQQQGFQQVELVKATEECWNKHYRHLKSWLQEQFKAGEIDEETYKFNVDAIDNLLKRALIDYALIAAKK